MLISKDMINYIILYLSLNIKGFKMLKKFGYEDGKGLGKESTGI